jgi:HEAT repeat protein
VSDEQLDLFSGSGEWVGRPRPRGEEPPAIAWNTVDDDTVIAAIAEADLVEGPALIAEAGRRKLARSIPALEALCRRFAGFGIERVVPEQWAAFEALAVIDGVEAAQAVARLIAKRVVQGPTLKKAVDAAARLGASLPADVVLELLRHDDPDIRAGACRCTRLWPPAISLLIDLLDDLQPNVGMAAACALGRLGRAEARPVLLRLLRDQPSPEIIDAIVPVADEDCVVLLGRVARLAPDQADATLDALEAIDHPRARTVAASVREARNI